MSKCISIAKIMFDFKDNKDAQEMIESLPMDCIEHELKNLSKYVRSPTHTNVLHSFPFVYIHSASTSL
jgi:hypothetical protein